MRKAKKRLWITLGIIGAVIILILMWIGGTYNSLITTEEEVNRAWANVQTAYQRRADLVPNLVATVKAYSDYEGEVLTEITNARAKVGSAGNPQALQEAGQELNGALSRLLVVVENYPNLKANQNYLDLQTQLEGTENRIKVERDVYNNAVKSYNLRVRRFPSNIIAGMFGFERKDSFEAVAGSDVAPDVGSMFQ